MTQTSKKPIPIYTKADWKVPKNIQTYIFTRNYGYSVNDFMSLNLASHVNDNINDVKKNRELIQELLPSEPIWINQNHGSNVAIINSNNQVTGNYDASITNLKNTPLAILTADCLPIFLTDIKGRFVGVVHAGWRGLENEIILNSINKIYHEYKINSDEIIAYIGPSICKKHFIIGKEVMDIFQNKKIYSLKEIFSKYINDKFLCDLKLIAKTQLLKLGLIKECIFISEECTYCLNSKYYSYRFANTTGRFASIIYLK